jgi:hypothetical protein
VSNTSAEPPLAAAGCGLAHVPRRAKSLYVSPFMPVDLGTIRLHAADHCWPTGGQLGGPVGFDATLSLAPLPGTRGRFGLVLLRYPR